MPGKQTRWEDGLAILAQKTDEIFEDIRGEDEEKLLVSELALMAALYLPPTTWQFGEPNFSHTDDHTRA